MTEIKRFAWSGILIALAAAAALATMTSNAYAEHTGIASGGVDVEVSSVATGDIVRGRVTVTLDADHGSETTTQVELTLTSAATIALFHPEEATTRTVTVTIEEDDGAFVEGTKWFTIRGATPGEIVINAESLEDPTQTDSDTFNVFDFGGDVQISEAPAALAPQTEGSVCVLVTDEDDGGLQGAWVNWGIAGPASLSDEDNLTDEDGEACVAVTVDADAEDGQSIRVSGSAHGVTASQTIVVGDPVDSEPGVSGFVGEIAPSGVSLVTFEGGTIADLEAAASAAGMTGVWATSAGAWVGLIIGAPEFVNADFVAAFPDGLSEGQPVVVVMP